MRTWKPGDTGTLYRYSFPFEGGMQVEEIEVVAMSGVSKEVSYYFKVTSSNRNGYTIGCDMVGKPVSGKYYIVVLEERDDDRAKNLVIEMMWNRILESFEDVTRTFKRIRDVKDA